MTVLVLYVVLVLVIGLWFREGGSSGEEFFVASRAIGPFVLLMTLFGTHMTAFSLLGASAEAYRKGIGVFALMASSSAIVAPLLFYFVGVPLWAAGKRHGFMTQVQYFRARFESNLLGILLFVVLVGLLVPYLLIGVMGAGLTVAELTGGLVPSWLAGLIVTLIVLVYVTAGGMRGTSLVNTFQTAVFLVLGAVALVWIVARMGGLAAALDRVEAVRPDLLIRGDAIRPWELVTYLFVPLSAGMFPHLFAHWLSAKRADGFRLTIAAYPLLIAIVWLPSVLLGVLARGDFPALEGPAAASVLMRLIHLHAPGALAGLLGAGVLAAVMSSLDSQVLAIGAIFTQDVVRHHGLGGRMSEKAQVLAGRLFIVAILLLSWTLSLFVTPRIFSLAVWSFTGYAGLLPLAIAAIYWRRSTRWGALAAVATVVALWSWYFFHGAQEAIPGTGIQVAAVVTIASAVVLVVVSLMTRPPSAETLERFFPAGSDQRA